MAITEVNIAGSFLTEVQWARDTIVRLKELKMRSAPIGVDPDTMQPDELFRAFAERGLLFFPYVRHAGLTLGAVDGYTANIATIVNYIEQERQQEILSVQAKIRELTDAQSQDLGVGLAPPDGHLDDHARYFVMRRLPIDLYYRGTPGVGSPAVYKQNVERLQEYVLKVSRATYR
jgi:hypothetical protein